VSTWKVAATCLAALVLGLIIVPLIQVVVAAFFTDGRFDGSSISSVVNSPNIGRTITNTLVLIVVSGSIALVVASVLAWIMVRTDAGLGRLGDLLPIGSLVLPKLGISIGWVFLAAPQAGYLNVAFREVGSWIGLELSKGPLNLFSWPGLIFLYTMDFVPYAYLVLRAALLQIDPSMEEAARMSGANPWTTLRTVTIPALRPAFAAAVFLIVVAGVSLYSIPVVVGTGANIDVLSVRTIRLVRNSYPPKLDQAIVLGLLMLIIIGAAWSIQFLVRRRGHFSTIGGKSAGASKVSLGRWRNVVRGLVLAFLAATSVLPVAGLILVSFQPIWSANIDWAGLGLDNYRSILFENRIAFDAIMNSLRLGVIAATIGMALAFILAIAARYSGGRLFAAVDAVTKLPAAISHIVLAVALLSMFAGPPFRLAGTELLLILAFVLIALPQGTVVASASVDQIGRDLEEASFMSGAGRTRTTRSVMVPLVRPGISVGWVILLVMVVGDLTASSILASPRTPVVGYVMLAIWENGTFSELAALSTIITFATTALVVLVLLVFGRSVVASGVKNQ